MVLTLTGFNLNNELLQQSRRFVNEVNQSISSDQNKFAQKRFNWLKSI